MTDATFEKLGRTSKTLYGPRKLVLCGFAPAAQSKFQSLLEMLGLSNLPLIWAGAKAGPVKLGELLSKPGDSGYGESSALPRAIIAAGIEENELHRLMAGCRQAGMQKALWAALTPTSETWPLATLLKELASEAAAMAQRKSR